MTAPLPDSARTRWWTIVRPQWRRLVLAGLAGAAAAGTGIALVATAAWLISRAAQHPPVLALTVAIVGVRAFGVGKGLFRYGERLAGHDAALRVRTDLRVRLYDRLIALYPAGLRHDRPGQLLRQLGSDVDGVVEVLARALLPYAAVTLAGLATAVGLAHLLPAAGGLLLAGLVLVLVAVPAVQRAVAGRAARRVAPLRAELTAGTVELLHGLPDLTAYAAVPQRLAALRATDERLRAVQHRSATSAGLGSALLALAAGGCVLGSLWAGSVSVHKGLLDPVLLAVVVLTPIAVFEAAAAIPSALEQVATARAALRRIARVLTAPDPTPDPTPDPPVAATAPSTVGPPYHLRLTGVSARWRPHGPLVLAGLDLDVPPGARVAVVGQSGAGKSTVAALLARLLDPVEGQVRLNGVDLRALPGDRIREIVTLLDSDAHLFDASVATNLRLGRPDATDAELVEALTRVRLDGWLEGLPDGLATRVGEHGALVSGGERRRLALARALLRDTAVLVLDEPTEHLDEPTADALLADLVAATAGRTVVLITHRRIPPGFRTAALPPPPYHQPRLPAVVGAEAASTAPSLPSPGG